MIDAMVRKLEEIQNEKDLESEGCLKYSINGTLGVLREILLAGKEEQPKDVVITPYQYQHIITDIRMQNRRIGEIEAKIGTETLKPKVKAEFERLERRVGKLETLLNDHCIMTTNEPAVHKSPVVGSGHTGKCQDGCQCDVAKMSKPSPAVGVSETISGSTSFDFLNNPKEDIYTLKDGKPICKPSPAVDRVDMDIPCQCGLCDECIGYTGQKIEVKPDTITISRKVAEGFLYQIDQYFIKSGQTKEMVNEIRKAMEG